VPAQKALIPDLDFALDDLPDLHGVLELLYEKGGPVVPILFAGRVMWLINGFETVKQAMTDEEHLSCAEAYQR
jgi:hypothetical protein